MDIRGSRSKYSRAFGRKVDQKMEDKDPLTRRGPRRMRARKKSDYGKHLLEVQVCRMLYGIYERQFRNYFKKAKAKRGSTADELLILLERRLDNAVYRCGLASTRRQGRQMVTHRHFWVNGRPVDRPSYLLRPGDIFEVKPTKLEKPIYKEVAEEIVDPRDGYWIQREGEEGFKYKVERLPGPDEAEQSFNASYIVEHYSKFV
ncbi:30S ribosomal protein S4 [bacterium]|nr:30S ribosomal protein S4 [bacterium]